MSVYHTPRCRILWTEVYQGGRPTNVVTYYGDLQLFFGISWDTAIWYTSGNFFIKFGMLQDGQIVASHLWSGWTPHLTSRPYPNFWIRMGWNRASDATNGRWGVILFQPSVHFSMWGPGGAPFPSEFAVAEQDHYLVVG